MTGLAGLLVRGLIGWAICGATIEVGRSLLAMPTTLVVHAIVAPLAFGALAWNYHERHPHSSPMIVSAGFVAVVIALDAGLVAPLLEHSYTMFRSALGTWIPFALIFAATYAVGRIRSTAAARPTRREKSVVR